MKFYYDSKNGWSAYKEKLRILSALFAKRVIISKQNCNRSIDLDNLLG